MPNPEKPKLTILRGGKTDLIPSKYNPYKNWTPGKLKELRDNGKKRSIETIKINSGLNITSTKPPEPDPDPAA